MLRGEWGGGRAPGRTDGVGARALRLSGSSSSSSSSAQALVRLMFPFS
jgi:hypothetical protein